MKRYRYYKSITSKRVISEPGDNTRYDYITVVVNKKVYFIPYRNDFKYPTHLDIDDVRDIKSIDDVHNFRNKKMIDIDVNPWTILECVRTTKLLFSEAILTDNAGTIHDYGRLSYISDLYRVLTANPTDVTEEDEILYGEKLHIEFQGKLRVETLDDVAND